MREVTNDQYLCGNINNHQMGKLFTTFVKEHVLAVIEGF